MNINTLIYEYTKLMTAAEACQSRREAVTLIRKATKLNDTIALMKESEGLRVTGSSDYCKDQRKTTDPISVASANRSSLTDFLQHKHVRLDRENDPNTASDYV